MILRGFYIVHLILFKRDYDTPLPLFFSTLGFLFLLTLHIFCGIQHGGHLQNPRAVNPPQPWGFLYGFARKGPGPFSVKCPVGLGTVCFFSDLWSKKITQLNIKDYQGVISRFHVWMHAGVSWDAGCCISTEQSMNNWHIQLKTKTTFRNILRIFNGCCNWVTIWYLPPIIREPETPLIYFQVFNPKANSELASSDYREFEPGTWGSFRYIHFCQHFLCLDLPIYSTDSTYSTYFTYSTFFFNNIYHIEKYLYIFTYCIYIYFFFYGGCISSLQTL